MSASSATTVGFIGLGNMGGNMAARLLAAGYAVDGEAKSRADAESLIGEGLQWCESPREAGRGGRRRFHLAAG